MCDGPPHDFTPLSVREADLLKDYVWQRMVGREVQAYDQARGKKQSINAGSKKARSGGIGSFVATSTRGGQSKRNATGDAVDTNLQSSIEHLHSELLRMTLKLITFG